MHLFDRNFAMITSSNSPATPQHRPAWELFLSLAKASFPLLNEWNPEFFGQISRGLMGSLQFEQLVAKVFVHQLARQG
jgi:hypothetical protein